MTLDHDKATALLNKDHVVVLGDLSSHHPLWGRPWAETAGKNLADILTRRKTVIINIGQCTHKDGARLDLAIVSPDLASLATLTINEKLASDHFAATTILQLDRPTPPPLSPCRNYKKANCQLFTEELDQAFMGKHGSLSIDKQESFIVAAFQKAVDKATPLIKRSHKHHNYWFCTARVGRAINLVNHYTAFLELTAGWAQAKHEVVTSAMSWMSIIHLPKCGGMLALLWASPDHSRAFTQTNTREPQS